MAVPVPSRRAAPPAASAVNGALARDPLVVALWSSGAVLYVRVTDAEGASYGVEDAIFALQQLAQTTMRSELGKMTLDNTFEERERLNTNIVRAINEAAATWGVKCLRYEIRDILPPTSVRVAMDMQAEAERRRRAEITEADGKKEAIIRRAQAEAQAIYARSEATAESIKRMAHSVVSHGGSEVVAVRLAEQYVQAFAELARKGNTLILPANAGDPAGMVAQALGIYDSLRSKTKEHAAAAAASSAAAEAPAGAPAAPTQDAIADGSLRTSSFPSTPLTGAMDDDNMPWRR